MVCSRLRCRHAKGGGRAPLQVAGLLRVDGRGPEASHTPNKICRRAVLLACEHHMTPHIPISRAVASDVPAFFGAGTRAGRVRVRGGDNDGAGSATRRIRAGASISSLLARAREEPVGFASRVNECAAAAQRVPVIVGRHREIGREFGGDVLRGARLRTASTPRDCAGGARSQWPPCLVTLVRQKGTDRVTMNALPLPAVPPWVPDDMLEELDLSELAAGRPELHAECARLGALLGAHIAAYRRNAHGRPRGLCSYYRVMDLVPSQVGELTSAEQAFPEVVFVAYRSPLERQPPKASPSLTR
jgi:hypothetical protein